MQFVALLTSLVAVVIVSSRFIVGDVLIDLASGSGIGIGLWGYFSGLERSSSAIVARVAGRCVYGDEVMLRQIAGIGIVLLEVIGVSIA
jgi:hypothetical protein